LLGNSSNTYCKRNSVPEVSETNGICKSAGGASGESAASMLIAKTVTSGDGLYADTYENGRYVYRGAAPTNYLWLDLNGNGSKDESTETFRIMSVETDNTIKVVSQNTIGNIVWDPGYDTVIDGVTSASSTTGTRYSSTSTDYCSSTAATYNYAGCNAWGSSTTTLDANGNNVTVMPKETGSSTTYTLPEKEAYLNTYLNTTYLNSINTAVQNKIATHTYNVGNLKNASDQTLATDISQESAYKWIGKIGLINATDYVRASSRSACTSSVYEYNMSYCYNYSDTHNYLFHSANAWTLSPCSYSSSNHVWFVASVWSLSNSVAYTSNFGVFPSFYLTSDISLSGEGTLGVPYEIVS